MTERIKPYSEEQMVRLLNELVEAYWKRNEASETVNEFEERNTQPTPPDSFDSVRELTDYNNSRARYDTRLGDLQGQLEVARRQYEWASENVRRVLPQGTSVVHMVRSNYVSGRYTISHLDSGEVKLGPPN